MSNLPRRSPRFSQQSQSSQTAVGSFPSFESSRTSSAASTSHPSPTSGSPDLTEQTRQYSLSLQSQFLAPPSNFDAPLPSPSANDIDPFGRTYQFNMSGQPQNQNTTNNGQSQQPQQHHPSFSQPQRPNYPPTSVNGIPPGLPADFLAEAAKRAQMACLMRDLGDVSL